MKRLAIPSLAIAFTLALSVFAGEPTPPAPVADEPATDKPAALAVKTGENITFDGAISKDEYADAVKVEFDLPEKKKAVAYFAKKGGFLFVAFDVGESHVYLDGDFPLNCVSLKWQIKGDDAQEFIFTPFNVRGMPFVYKRKDKAAKVSGWAAKANFRKVGYWQAEFKISMEVLGLRPDTQDAGEFRLSVTGRPPDRKTGLGRETVFPAGGTRELTCADKWAEPDEKEADLLDTIVKNAAEVRNLTIKLMNFFMERDLKKILETGDKVLEKAPNCYMINFLIGLYKKEVHNDYKAAAAQFEKALETNPSFRTICRELAQIYADALGEKEKAIAVWKALVDAEPSNAVYLLEYISFQADVTLKFEEAAANAAEAAKKFPDNPLFLIDQGNYLFQANLWDNASAVLEKARKLAIKQDKAGLIENRINPLISFVEEYKKYDAEWKEADADKTKKDDRPQVKLQTSKGEILLELFEDRTPNTTANFITLVEKGFYDGTKFHRVISGFMAQGGDPNSKNDNPLDDGHGGPGYRISGEISTLKHMRGVISMANSGPDTEGSQFFITTAHKPHLDTIHAVFGRVIKGQDVVDSLKINDVLKKATVIRKRDHEYKVKKR